MSEAVEEALTSPARDGTGELTNAAVQGKVRNTV